MFHLDNVVMVSYMVQENLLKWDHPQLASMTNYLQGQDNGSVHTLSGQCLGLG